MNRTFQYKRLIAGIFYQAVIDWRKGGFETEIEDFLQSEWFAFIADELEFDPKAVSHKLRTGSVQYQAMHSVYR